MKIEMSLPMADASRRYVAAIEAYDQGNPLPGLREIISAEEQVAQCEPVTIVDHLQKLTILMAVPDPSFISEKDRQNVLSMIERLKSEVFPAKTAA